MTNEERIKQFEQQNPPFMLYDHNDGSFSLGLPFTFLEGRYKNYGQAAFNRYAIERGDPVKNGGLYTPGNGYEWETVFQKAFEQDENLQRIDFDSEAGAFFCYTDDLSLLEDFGRRFRDICEDQESFASLVREALAETEQEKKLAMHSLTDKKLEVVEVLGQTALFTNGRVTEQELPEGLYKYDLREGEDIYFSSIEPHVLVNHGETVLLKTPLDFGDAGYFVFDDDSSPNFLGYRLTPKEFMETDFTEQEEEDISIEQEDSGGMQL